MKQSTKQSHYSWSQVSPQLTMSSGTTNPNTQITPWPSHLSRTLTSQDWQSRCQILRQAIIGWTAHLQSLSRAAVLKPWLLKLQLCSSMPTSIDACASVQHVLKSCLDRLSTQRCESASKASIHSACQLTKLEQSGFSAQNQTRFSSQTSQNWTPTSQTMKNSRSRTTLKGQGILRST